MKRPKVKAPPSLFHWPLPGPRKDQTTLRWVLCVRENSGLPDAFGAPQEQPFGVFAS